MSELTALNFIMTVASKAACDAIKLQVRLHFITFGKKYLISVFFCKWVIIVCKWVIIVI